MKNIKKINVEVLQHSNYLKQITEHAAIVVCMPIPTPEFPDNLQGVCDVCGTDIYYRPYNSKATKKVCVACALEIMDKQGIPKIIGASDKSLDEIKKMLGVKGKND